MINIMIMTNLNMTAAAPHPIPGAARPFVVRATTRMLMLLIMIIPIITNQPCRAFEYPRYNSIGEKSEKISEKSLK